MKKKIIFIVEAEVEGKNPKDVLKRTRAVRSAIKRSINALDGARATRIQNKDKM